MVRWHIAAVLAGASVVAVTVAAVMGTHDEIARDLDQRVTEALAGETTSWADAKVVGRDVLLTGAAPSEELRKFAAERVGRVFGVRVVDLSATALLPEQTPYKVELSRRGHVLDIAGFAPSLPDRRRMVDAFTKAVPDLAYNDRLSLARGLPDDSFLVALSELYPLLGWLSEGSILLEDHRVVVKGMAASNADYDRLARALPSLPQGYGFASVDVVRPVAHPFVWSLTKDGNGVSVRGFAPDAETRSTLFGAVRANAGAAVVRDEVDLASGAPDHFSEAVSDAAGYLDLFETASMEVSDATIAIAGRASTPDAYRTLNAFLDTWSPRGFTVSANVDLPVVTPYTFAASRRDDKLTVTGFMPDEDLKSDIVEAAASVVRKAPVIETTVAAGAPQGFAEAMLWGLRALGHFSEGTLFIQDDRLKLLGTANEASDLIELDAEASSGPAGFKVEVVATPPQVSPYVWAVERDAEQFVISGSAPSEQVRTAVRDAIESIAGDAAVVDRSQLASGLDDHIDLAKVASTAAHLLADLQSGTVSLTSQSLSVVGQAATGKQGLDVVARMDQPLPQGVRKGIVQVDFPPSFQFRIARNLDTVLIEGTYADDAMKAAIESAAAAGFGTANVTFALQPGVGLPADAAKVAVLAVKAAALFGKGEVSVEGTTITASGKAFTGVGAVRLSSDVAAEVPKGYRLDTSVGVMKAEAPMDAAGCDKAIGDVLAHGTIAFSGDSAAISTDSHGLLDRIGWLADSCREAALQVEARRDGSADPAAAQTLAEERARAVGGFLADVGVDAGRIRVGVAEPGATAAANAPHIVIHAVPMTAQ